MRKVVSEIREAASKAESFQDKALEPVWKFSRGIYEAQQYLQTFESVQDHPFVEVGIQPEPRVFPLKFDSIIGMLRYIIDESISIPSTILSSSNDPAISPDCPAPTTFKYLLTPGEIKEILTRMYSLLPKLYSEFVNKNFPNLRQYLGYCRIYPFKYVIHFREKNNKIFSVYSFSKVYILPVSSESEMTADVIEEKGEENQKWTRDNFDSIHREYVEKLKQFRRYNETNSGKFSIKYGVIDDFSKRPLTNAIYSLLRDDMKNLWKK